MGVHPEIVAALAESGITRAFAIQSLTLPIAQAGSDLIGQARTGTGKTLGFGIPLLGRVLPPSRGGTGTPQALIVVPTRELCLQVSRDLSAAGARLGVRTAAVYGGRAYEPQIAELKRGVEVVVGTPGRLLDLVNQKLLRLDAISILVLDEADEMLDLGFLPDIERLLSALPTVRQTMLFSATMPGPIVALARQFMNKPVHVRAEDPGESHTVPTTAQHIFRTHAMDKTEVLARVLQARERGLVMVFCRTKRTAQKLSDELVDRGFAAASVHGDLGQGAREQALRAFRAGKVDVLVATDVAARGIDITGVTHVINFQCPEDEKTYLHRIGRTGRAGASGVAVTFVDWDDLARWQVINKLLSLPFHEPTETYSTSEHLYAELNIPESISGSLPEHQRTRAGLAAERVEGSNKPSGRGKVDSNQKRTRRGGTRRQKRGTERSPEVAPTKVEAEKPARQKQRVRRRTRGGDVVARNSSAPAKKPHQEASD